MVLWELGKVSTGFITREERSRVGRRSPGGECCFLVPSIALITSASENYLLVLTLPSFPREGWVASQISLVTTGMRVLVWLGKTKNKKQTRAPNQENTGWSFRRKKEARLHEPLVQQLVAPYRGSEPLAVDRTSQQTLCFAPWRPHPLAAALSPCFPVLEEQQGSSGWRYIFGLHRPLSNRITLFYS